MEFPAWVSSALNKIAIFFAYLNLRNLSLFPGLQNYGVRKLAFLLTLLEMGLDVSLSDTDVVWCVLFIFCFVICSSE